MRLALLLCLLSAPALAAPLPAAEVLTRLPVDAGTRDLLSTAIRAVFGHNKAKELNPPEEARQCAELDMLAALLRVMGLDDALKTVGGPRDEWCKQRGGRKGADEFALALARSGVVLRVPKVQRVGPKEDFGTRALQALMTAGLFVQAGAEAAATAVLPVLVLPPKPHREDEGL